MAHKDKIKKYWAEYYSHNIYDDKLREKRWDEIDYFIDELIFHIENMPRSLQKSSINHQYIKELGDIQAGYL